MATRRSVAVQAALAQVAPGTPLREGLDRIVKAKMGALVIVGDGPEVLNICSGGFLLDAVFSPQRLSELAKMDGAIVQLGVDARLIRLQLDELMGDVEDDRYFVIQDYHHDGDDRWNVDDALSALANLSTDELLDLRAVAATLHRPGGGSDLDHS